jgi:hypothetical protein
MADHVEANSSDLADWLRRWIVIAGYFIAGWGLLQMSLEVISWGPLFYLHLRIGWPGFLALLFEGLCLSALVLLLVGCWGFQHQRRWARPVLLTYAGTWLTFELAAAAFRIIDTLAQRHPALTPRTEFAFLVSQLDPVISGSLYAFALVLCLRRPELRDQFPEMRRGFAPVFRDDAGSV